MTSSSNFFRYLLLLATLFLIGACSSGNEDSESKEPETGTALDIVSSPADYSSTELKNAYDSVIAEKYQGSINTEVIDLQEVLSRLEWTFGENNLTNIGLKLNRYEYLLKFGEIDQRLTCLNRGTSDFKGQYVEGQESHFEFSYENCFDGDELQAAYGDTALKLIKYSESESHYIQFTNSLELNIDESAHSITGYIETHRLDEGGHNPDYTLKRKRHYLMKNLDSGSEVRIQSEITIAKIGSKNTFHEIGTIFDSSSGMVTFEHNDSNATWPTILNVEFKGSNTVLITQENNDQIKVSLDSDNDGVYETGGYHYGVHEVLSMSAEDVDYSSFDQMSMRPWVPKPVFRLYNLTTKDRIEINHLGITDPDNDLSEFDVSFEWSINGEIYEGQNTEVFPANIAVHGDQVSVAAIATDGINTVRSESEVYEIQNTALEARLVNLADVLMTGETVTFTAEVIDPDTPNAAPLTAALVYGPEGAMVNSDGTITWTTPSKQLLTEQLYHFGFEDPENTDNTLIASIKVHNDSAKMTSVIAPAFQIDSHLTTIYGYSDNAGRVTNKLLHVDYYGSIFSISKKDEKYQFQLLNEFEFSKSGKVKQVLPVKSESNNTSEIVVVTERAIYLFDLNSKVKTRLVDGNYIEYATVADVNNDQNMELIFIERSVALPERNSLTSISLANPQHVYFDEMVGLSNHLIAADLIGDENKEILLSSGQIIDSSSGEEIRTLGEAKYQQKVYVADFMGNGKPLIITRGESNSIDIINVNEENELVDSIEGHNCGVVIGNFDEDTADEMLIFGCFYSKDILFEYDGNQLIQTEMAFELQSGTYNTISGDIDNDGIEEIVFSNNNFTHGVLEVNDDAEPFELFDSAKNESVISLGWEGDNALFFSPNTGVSSTKDESALISISPQNIDSNVVPQKVTYKITNSDRAYFYDFNNDGNKDLLIQNHLESSVELYNIADDAQLWQPARYSNAYSSESKNFLPFKFEGDDAPHLIFSDNNKIKVFEPQSETTVFSKDLNTQVEELSVGIIDGVKYVVASADDLKLLKQTRSTFTVLQSIEKRCIKQEFVNWDEDSQLEFMCFHQNGEYSYDDMQLTVFDIENERLKELHTVAFSNSVQDIVIDDHSSNNPQIYVLEMIELESSSVENKLQISQLNGNGRFVWSSPFYNGADSYGQSRGLWVDNLKLESSDHSVNLMFKFGTVFHAALASKK